MKLEVGMYVRTDLGEIGKVTNIVCDDVFKTGGMTFYNSEPYLKGNEIKVSFNIIDLIEVGDILVDDTNRKLEVYYDEELDYLYVQCIDGDNNLYCESIRKQSFINNIKAIVTKEQMEQISYKIKE